MTTRKPLPAESLCWQCDGEQLGFDTTDDLEDLEGFLGQPRALDAVQFGIGIRREGYNMYVLGPPGVGKRTIVESFLVQKSASEPQPPDWCYVNNFDDPQRPKVLMMEPGRGVKLVGDMDSLIEHLKTSIPAALEEEQHQQRIEQIEEEAKQQQEEAFQKLTEKAKAQGIQMVRTPAGFAVAPVRDGEPISTKQFEELPEDERKRIQASVEQLEEELRELVEEIPEWKRQARDVVKDANREKAGTAIAKSFARIRRKYKAVPEILAHLDAVQKHVLENVDDFCPEEEDSPAAMLGAAIPRRNPFEAYKVNLVVNNAETEGSPVIYEEHPSYQNLIGRVEQQSQMGTLVTNFSLIRPGSMHRANGGYLVIDALRLLQQPYAWEGLKRALYARHIKIESLGESLSLVSTVSLEPQPIPLDVKVVLLGDRSMYYLLYQHDPDFAELFKVAADFQEDMQRGPGSCLRYAQLIATLVRREKHLPFDRTAVARVVERSARVAGDAGKLTTHMRTIADLIREADYWAMDQGARVVTADHVQKAIDQQIYRSDRVRDRVQESIEDGTMLIDTDGEVVAQVNGLSVLDLGNFQFGRPSRITATARLGKGEVLDIEREVDLGGAIHSKGVMILSSLLASRYATEQPLSLSATLAFEQSYGMVDGDSASVAEFCVLLSALSGLPIKQSLAVTGSINQHGQVQPIGGVNEKIEGFFDVCQARGLTGNQGVLIPASNQRHLMLRSDVVQAAREGRFHIYAVETVDEAVTLLTGVPAGQRGDDGQYPDETVNAMVSARLAELFQIRKKLSEPQAGDAAK